MPLDAGQQSPLDQRLRHAHLITVVFERLRSFEKRSHRPSPRRPDPVSSPVFICSSARRQAARLLDQVAMHNNVPGIYFTFAERRKDLGIKTLARLSEIDSREIRRGSAYLLHWYGVPKAHHSDAAGLALSWDKITKSAQEAKPWLDRVYVVECSRGTDLAQIKAHIGDVQSTNHANRVIAVIDDCQRLGAIDQPLNARLPIIAEQLQETAVYLNIPILGVWPDLREDRGPLPQDLVRASSKRGCDFGSGT